MADGQIVVEALVDAPAAKAWDAYSNPVHVTQWNFADDTWHCPSATSDLRAGGNFSSRMEAKDGSMGFDFAGTYTEVIENELIGYRFGDRTAKVEFIPADGKTLVRVTFDPENEYPLDQQQAGWQSILNNYADYTATL